MISFTKFKVRLERMIKFLKSEQFLAPCLAVLIVSTVAVGHLTISIFYPKIFVILLVSYFVSFLLCRLVKLLRKREFKEILNDLWKEFKELLECVWKDIKKCLLTSKNKVVEWLYGKRYFVRINKTWSVQRARRFKRKDIRRRIVVRYGPDKHKWILENDDYKIVRSNMSQADSDDLVIKANISELKRIHLSKQDKQTDLNPIEHYYFGQDHPDW